MTTSQRILSIICLMALIALFVLASWLISGNRSYNKGWSDALASITPDTEYVDKPVYIDKPVPVEVKPAGMEMYPIGTLAQLQQMVDSLAAVRPDTSAVVIPIPMETKTYRDSTYEAQISGYNPKLDWIKINQRTAYITVPIPQPVYPELILSPSVTAMLLPKNVFIGAGLEAQYWRGRLEFSVETGYGINFSPDGNHHGPYVIGKTKYNLIRK